MVLLWLGGWGGAPVVWGAPPFCYLHFLAIFANADIMGPVTLIMRDHCHITVQMQWFLSGYLPVKYHSHSYDIPLVFQPAYYFIYCSCTSLPWPYERLKAKIIPCSTDFANWSCHQALQIVPELSSQHKAMWQVGPCDVCNTGLHLRILMSQPLSWITPTASEVLQIYC